MAEKSRKGWYIGFGAILTALGTFLVTTDPIFHYGDLLKDRALDSTEVIKNISNENFDSLRFSVPKVRTLSQIDREVQENKRKNSEQDSLIKKHEEILK
jgi:hypothetical protein